MKIEYGEKVLLWDPRKGKGTVFLLKEGGEFGSHNGVISHDDMAGRKEGCIVETNTGYPYVLLRPSLAQRMMNIRRRTQIIYPKDAGWLVVHMGVTAGSRVVEMGTGSGAFTMLLAAVVGPSGRVYTFDRREEFQKNAMKNIREMAPHLLERISFAILEAGEPFPVEEPVEAVMLDLPEPWRAFEAAYKVMKAGGSLGIIVPTAEQLKECYAHMREVGFLPMETVEVLERGMRVRIKEGVRPREVMTGFTGYLTVARKIEKVAATDGDAG